MSEAPMATCYADGEPLVMTFEFPGYEFICVVCDTKYEFFGPKAADVTPELQNRYEELKIQYDEERKQRQEMQSP